MSWVRLWCVPPTHPLIFTSGPPIQRFLKICNFMYTSRIYQHYCSVMYIYRDIHVFMFPFFFKLWFYYKIFLVIMHHSFGNLNPSIHIPKYPLITFWGPIGNYFLGFSHSYNINYDFEKYSSIILTIICHMFRNFNPSVYIPKYPFIPHR